MLENYTIRLTMLQSKWIYSAAERPMEFQIEIWESQSGEYARLYKVSFGSDLDGPNWKQFLLTSKTGDQRHFKSFEAALNACEEIAGGPVKYRIDTVYCS